MILLDECNPISQRSPRENSIKVRAESINKLDALSNLAFKRYRCLDPSVELVKYAALEGTSLSFLGLLKYDADKQCFEMT